MCNQGPARPYRNTPTAPRIGTLTLRSLTYKLAGFSGNAKVQWTFKYSVVNKHEHLNFCQ